MRATFIYGAGDVRVIEVPDPALKHPSDALVRIVRSCICGSDLHPYHSMAATPAGRSMGHESLGVVEEAGSEVATVGRGDLVVVPFAWQDNTCDFCREGLQTSCRHGGFWNAGDVGGMQAEAVRVPLADGTLVKLPVAEDSALLPSLLTLSDVLCTGHHAAVRAGGVISRVGVPQYDEGDIGWNLFGRNLRLTGGPAPARNYIEELMPDILDGAIEPGRVFDRTIGLDEVPDGYRAMDRRDALKVLVRP